MQGTIWLLFFDSAKKQRREKEFTNWCLILYLVSSVILQCYAWTFQLQSEFHFIERDKNLVIKILLSNELIGILKKNDLPILYNLI
jgi:hypothetical protein